MINHFWRPTVCDNFLGTVHEYTDRIKAFTLRSPFTMLFTRTFLNPFGQKKRVVEGQDTFAKGFNNFVRGCSFLLGSSYRRQSMASFTRICLFRCKHERKQVLNLITVWDCFILKLIALWLQWTRNPSAGSKLDPRTELFLSPCKFINYSFYEKCLFHFSSVVLRWDKSYACLKGKTI